MIVVFDIGGVLIRWNPRSLLRRPTRGVTPPPPSPSTARSIDVAAMAGVVAGVSGAMKARAGALPKLARELHLFDGRWVEIIGIPIEENVALLRRLKAAGRPVHALSNFASVKFALARRMYDVLNAFDVCVVSGHVGVAKPDRRIYEILFEQAARKPHELVLIDDTIANARAAEILGMAAIHYRPGVDLEAELKRRDVAL